MADTLQEALEQLMENSTTEGPSDTVLVINNNLRTIAIPSGFIFGVYNDKNVLSVPFEMPRSYAGNDLSEFSIRVNFVSAAGTEGIYEIESPTIGTDKIEFEWLLDRAVFTGSGDVTFNVCLRKLDANDEVIKEYNTTTAKGSVLAGLEVDDPENPEAISIYEQMRNMEANTNTYARNARNAASEAVTLLTEVNTKADEIIADAAAIKELYGTPLVAPTAADMTKQNRIYVYTGSESGYTNGNWYYYDGSAWVSGGVYNSAAINTDTTLSVSGMAADAAAVGDLKNALSQLEAVVAEISLRMEN